MKQKINVLVADDKEFMRQALARLIETEENLELVGTAVNGEDAVKKAAEIKPQVVVMDIRMPGINGIEASHLGHLIDLPIADSFTPVQSRLAL